LKKSKIDGKTWFIFEPHQSLNAKGRTRINKNKIRPEVTRFIGSNVVLKCGCWQNKPRLALDRVRWQGIGTSAVENPGSVSGETFRLSGLPALRDQLRTRQNTTVESISRVNNLFPVG
jgi:hypothetical protein